MKTFCPGFAMPRALWLFLIAIIPLIRLAGAEPDVTPLRAKAEKGNSVAQYYLGLVYAEGRAIPKDPVEAYVWLSIAAENGATGKALSVLITEMSPDQLAAAKSRLDERRRATPSVIFVRQTGPSSTPAEDRSGSVEQEAAVFRIDKAKLSDELAAAWKEADGAKAAAADAEKRAQRADAALNLRTKDLNALQAERDQLRQQLAAAPTASAVDTLRQDRDKVAGRLATANTDMQALRERMAKIEAENERLQQAAASAAQTAASMAALQQDRDKVAGRLATANTDMQSLRERMAKMDAENDRLQQASASLAALQRDRDEQAKSLAAAQTTATELTAQLKKLGEEKTALAQANAKIEEQAKAGARQAGDEAAAKAELARHALETTLAEQTQKLAALTTQLETTRKSLAVAEAGQAQAAAAAGKLEAARKELTAAQNTNADLTVQLKKLTEEKTLLIQQAGRNSESSQEVASLKTKLGQLESELSTARARAAELVAANQKLEQQVHSAAPQSDEIVRAKAALAAADQRLRQTEAALGQRDKDLAVLQADLQNTRRTVKDLDAAQAATAAEQNRKERDALRQQLEAARQEVAAARNSSPEQSAQVKKLAEDNAAFARQLAERTDAAKAEVARLQDQVATLTRDGEAARKNFATVQSVAAAQAGESTGQLTELRLELQQAKKELAEKNAALSRQLAEGTDAAKQLAAVNGQLDDTHKELTALKSSQAELNESVRRLTEERGRLQAQGIATDAGKAEIARLQDQVATLTRKGEAARKDLAAAQTAAASQVGENTSQLAGLRLELQQAKKDLAESRTQNQSLQEASQRLEHQGKATTDAAVRLAEAQSDIEQLKRENASLQAERNALTARLAQSAPAVAATAAATVASADSGSGEEVARLKEELAREQSKVEMTVRSFALAQQENERLKAQIDQGGVSAGQARDTGATLAGAQRDLATVRADASKAAAETAALRDLLRQVQNSNAGFAAENARLRAALAMAGGALPAGLASHPVRPAMAAASVATPPAAQVNAAPAPRTHKVVSGDTLSQISSRYYGTPSRWQDIYNANRDKLRNPDVLPLDVELKVP